MGQNIKSPTINKISGGGGQDVVNMFFFFVSLLSILLFNYNIFKYFNKCIAS